MDYDFFFNKTDFTVTVIVFFKVLSTARLKNIVSIPDFPLAEMTVLLKISFFIKPTNSV